MDILVQTKDGPRAIEIETGKSDAKGNVQKCEKARIPVMLTVTEREGLQVLGRQMPGETSIACVLDGLWSFWEFIGLK